jgi:hypothetical protein
MVSATGPPTPPEKDGRPLWELTKHVFIGVGVFLLLAVPAITLDFFNQGVNLIKIGDVTAVQSGPNTITVSSWVKWTLYGVEWLILGVDVVFVGAYVINGMWNYLKSLKW